MKSTLLASAIALACVTNPSFAEPVAYNIDESHAQLVFSYNHQGWSLTYGMVSGFDGEVMFDEADPASSSVSVSFPLSAINTGWAARDEHVLGAQLLGAAGEEEVTFVSTGVEVTGEDTALITGDLTLNGVTKSTVLDTKLMKKGESMMSGAPMIGFSATTQILRSDFNAGMFAPVVSDEVDVSISFEAVAE